MAVKLLLLTLPGVVWGGVMSDKERYPMQCETSSVNFFKVNPHLWWGTHEV
jgi:hypothetical protein